MSELEGYSYYQWEQLNALDGRLNKADSMLGQKQENIPYETQTGDLDIEDGGHYRKIANLYKVKADVTDYNSRVQQLDGNDAAHTALMNQLETTYNGKASKAGFEEKMKELDANDATHDVRLDALERQFDGIESRVLGEVTTKVSELALNTDFNALVAELQAKDTELGNKIIQLATEEDIRNAVSNYQTALAGLQTKPEYNTEIGKLVNRHQDFEARFTAIDQFFRVMVETYKLYNNETGDEIVYTTMGNSSIELSPENEIYTIIGYSSYSGSQSYSSELKLQFTKYGYNTLNGTLKVFFNNTEVGSISKSNINSTSLIAIIPAYATVAQLKQGFTINKMYSNGDVDTINSKTYTASMVATIPDLTPVTISYSSSNYLFISGDSGTIPAPTVTGAVAGYSVSGLSGLTISSSGVISGSITTGGKYQINVTATGSNGTTAQATIFITVREFYNLYPSTFNGTNIEGVGYKTLRHTFTSGNAGSYGFYLNINNNYSKTEEFITKLYKINTTDNLLVGATDLSNVLSSNGTIYFNSIFTNTSSTPNFNVALESNTTYYLECVTTWNDDSSDAPPIGADVSVSIENNWTPITLSFVNSSTELPSLTGDRNSISFTSPIPLGAKIIPMSNAPTYPILFVINAPAITFTSNSPYTYNFTTPISPVFNSVKITNAGNTSITTALELPAGGSLPTITASGNASSLSLTFTPNLYPVASSSAVVQFLDGGFWVNSGSSFNISNNTSITRTITNVSTTCTKARIVNITNSIATIFTQEVDISTLVAPVRSFTGVCPDYSYDNPGIRITADVWFRFTFNTGSNAGTYKIFTSKDNAWNDDFITSVYATGSTTNLLETSTLNNISYTTYNSITALLPQNAVNTSSTPNITLNGLLANTTYNIVIYSAYNDTGDDDFSLAVEYGSVNVPITYSESLDYSTTGIGPSLKPSLTVSGTRPALTFSFTSQITSASAQLQFTTDGTTWINYDAAFAVTAGTLYNITKNGLLDTYIKARIIFGSAMMTQAVTLPAAPVFNRTFHNLVKDTNPDGTPLSAPALGAAGQRYFRHYFNITQAGDYKAFLSMNPYLEEAITIVYKEGTSTNLITGLPLGSNISYGTFTSNSISLTGIKFNSAGIKTNNTSTPDFTLTSLTPGKYYIIVATTWNDGGNDTMDMGIVLEDSTGTALSFTYDSTSSTEITMPIISKSFSSMIGPDYPNVLTNGTINAFAKDDSGNVYVGGSFSKINNVNANNIAKWTPSGSGSGVWSALGSGTTDTGNGVNNTVNAIAINGNDVYVGGLFTSAYNADGGGANAITANKIAKWNGSSWSTLGTGVTTTGNGMNSTGTVYAIAVDQTGNVYVGGAFTSAYNADGGGVNTISANKIAKWDGTSWSALGTGITTTGNGVSSTVNAIAINGNDVYVGGAFSSAYNADGGGVNTISANKIAKWNGTSWSALGTGTGTAGNGVSSTVNAIAINGNDVYVGGAFTSAYNAAGGGVNTISANRIAKWNGTSWSALGAGSGTTGNGLNSTGTVYAIAIKDNDVYVGGYGITTAYNSTTISVSANNIVKWTPSAPGSSSGVWSALGTGNGTTGNGINSYVYAIGIKDNDVYIGGSFTTGYNSANSSINSFSLLVFNSNFSSIGNIFKTANTINASAVDGSGNIYIGGNFKYINNVSANNIAKWTPSAPGSTNGVWSALGTGTTVTGNGVDSTVQAIAINGNDVYIGGFFASAYNSDTTTAISANKIAKWNGTSWSALGTGTGTAGNGLNSTGTVFAIAIKDNDVYVGGAFSTAYNSVTSIISVNKIAKWNGTSWSTLGGSMSNGAGNTVYAITIKDNDVYVGGTFSAVYNSSGTVNANKIAKWNITNSSWSALGTGITTTGNGTNGDVYAIAINVNDIYVGGAFSSVYNADGGGVNTIAASRIAKWNGTSWSALGSGSGGNGVNGTNVNTIAINGTDVYVGGYGISAAYNAVGNSIAPNNIVKWNGSSWSILGTGINNGVDNTVKSITVSSDTIYIAGLFAKAGDLATGPFVKYV